MPNKRILFLQALSSNGDGTGTINFNANHSVTQGRGYITPGTGEVIYITEIKIHVADNGNFTRGGFGAGSALSNGITLNKIVSGTTYTLTNIKINDDLPHAFSRYNTTSWSGIEDSMTGYIDVGTNHGGPIMLQTGDSINMYLDDNLSGLVEVECFVSAYKDIEA